MNPRVWAEFDHSLAKKNKYLKKKTLSVQQISSW